MSEGVKIQVKVQDSKQVVELSPHHKKIRDAMKETAMRGQFWPEWSAGASWKDNLGSLIGFLMPYGTKNCFWNRLNMSVTFRHLFHYDEEFIGVLKGLENVAHSTEPFS